MKKRICALLAAMAICVGLSVPTFAGEFSDVPDGAWCAEAVTWAVERGIAQGIGNGQFAPFRHCTKAEILTFLWRYKNSPEPTIPNPFSDVSVSHYYYKAAVWAYEKGLLTETALEANTPCTRSMTVTYLWKLAGSPFANITGEIVDVPVLADYAQAVAWALEKGVTTGVRSNTFDPDRTCMRAEIVTFLCRFDSLALEAEPPEPDLTPADPEPVPDPEPEPLSIGTSMSKSASIVGSMYFITFSLSVNATGGSGEYSYKFEVLQNGESIESTWTSNNGISGKLSGVGTCVVEIVVKDSDRETANTTVDLLETGSRW